MFTVFGANGNTGSGVARRLLDAGKQVRLVVRDPAKVAALRSRGAEVLKGDVLDAGAVESALAGAEGAYLLVPPDNRSNDLLARGRKIVDDYVAGLSKAKVPHAVMLSSIGAQRPSGTGPIVTVHYAETILPEFDREMANTRKVLERVPEDKLDWKAHPRFRTLGWNANHLAEIPGWVEGVLTAPSWAAVTRSV